MRLEITVTSGVLALLAICALATAAWHEPMPSVLTAEEGLGYCPVRQGSAHDDQPQANPDLLLLMFGLSRGRSGHG